MGASSGDSGHRVILRSPAGGLQSAGLARFVAILRFAAVVGPQMGLQSLARGLHP